MDFFYSTEIIREVESNGSRLDSLLETNLDELDPDCLNRALMAAVKIGNHISAGKIITKAANKTAKIIDKSLQLSIELKQYSVGALLTLVKAAVQGDQILVQRLFDENLSQEEDFQEMQVVISNKRVSTVVPIEIARCYNNLAVRQELLLKTDVNPVEGSVLWHGLRLLVLDVSWLREIHWVKHLRLERNGFRELPSEIGSYLRQVCLHTCGIRTLHACNIRCSHLDNSPSTTFFLGGGGRLF